MIKINELKSKTLTLFNEIKSKSKEIKDIRAEMSYFYIRSYSLLYDTFLILGQNILGEKKILIKN